jgi:hypothetical protein
MKTPPVSETTNGAEGLRTGDGIGAEVNGIAGNAGDGVATVNAFGYPEETPRYGLQGN